MTKSLSAVKVIFTLCRAKLDFWHWCIWSSLFLQKNYDVLFIFFTVRIGSRVSNMGCL